MLQKPARNDGDARGDVQSVEDDDVADVVGKSAILLLLFLDTHHELYYYWGVWVDRFGQVRTGSGRG